MREVSLDNISKMDISLVGKDDSPELSTDIFKDLLEKNRFWETSSSSVELRPIPSLPNISLPTSLKEGDFSGSKGMDREILDVATSPREEPLLAGILARNGEKQLEFSKEDRGRSRPLGPAPGNLRQGKISLSSEQFQDFPDFRPSRLSLEGKTRLEDIIKIETQSRLPKEIPTGDSLPKEFKKLPLDMENQLRQYPKSLVNSKELEGFEPREMGGDILAEKSGEKLSRENLIFRPPPVMPKKVMDLKVSSSEQNVEIPAEGTPRLQNGEVSKGSLAGHRRGEGTPRLQNGEVFKMPPLLRGDKKKPFFVAEKIGSYKVNSDMDGFFKPQINRNPEAFSREIPLEQIGLRIESGQSKKLAFEGAGNFDGWESFVAGDTATTAMAMAAATGIPEEMPVLRMEGGGYDRDSLIGKISDYLIESGIKNSRSLEVVVDHEDLGRFRINAQRLVREGQIDLSIESFSREALDFFNKNEVLLIKELIHAGVGLSGIKVVDSRDGSFLENNSISFEEETSGQEKGESYRDQEREDSKRRHHLWKEFAKNSAGESGRNFY